MMHAEKVNNGSKHVLKPEAWARDLDQFWNLKFIVKSHVFVVNFSIIHQTIRKL